GIVQEPGMELSARGCAVWWLQVAGEQLGRERLLEATIVTIGNVAGVGRGRLAYLDAVHASMVARLSASLTMAASARTRPSTSAARRSTRPTQGVWTARNSEGSSQQPITTTPSIRRSQCCLA